MEILALVDNVLSVLNAALDNELSNAEIKPLKYFYSYEPTREAGIYAICANDIDLMRNHAMVYIGSATNLRTRLREHSKSIIAATELDILDYGYRCVPCGKVAALAVEKYLIEKYLPVWNMSGFGSKANGNGRRHGKPSFWDERYGRAVIR